MRLNLSKDVQGSIDVLYNHLAELNDLIYNIPYIKNVELTENEKKIINEFYKESKRVEEKIRRRKTNDPNIVNYENTQRFIEEIENLIRRLSGPLITVCEELYVKYNREIRPILYSLDSYFNDEVNKND